MSCHVTTAKNNVTLFRIMSHLSLVVPWLQRVMSQYVDDNVTIVKHYVTLFEQYRHLPVVPAASVTTVKGEVSLQRISQFQPMMSEVNKEIKMMSHVAKDDVTVVKDGCQG